MGSSWVAITGSISISAFASLVGIPIGIANSAEGLNLPEINAGRIKPSFLVVSSWLSEDVYKLLRRFIYNNKLVIRKKWIVFEIYIVG